LKESCEKIKNVIHKDLSKSEFVSVTLDGWSSVANDSYLGFTCHFVNDDFELNSRMLALQHIPERHTAENLSSEIVTIVKNWNIQLKITTATIDGASNINLAVDKTSFLDKLNCITHIMNLVTKGILNNNTCVKVNDLVKKCRNLVGTFKHSNFLTDQLNKAMQQRRSAAERLENNNKELPRVTTLKQDVPTRWNSTFIMLESILNSMDCIKMVINNNSEMKKKYSNILLNGNYIEILEDLLHLLKLFFNLQK
jgi:hypothetical protein